MCHAIADNRAAMTAQRAASAPSLTRICFPQSGRTRSSRVKALSHMLNAGYVDASDEYRFRSNLARATALGGKNYYINDSGELFYRQGASVPQSGPSAAAGQGVQVA